ncbi:MAG: hypothetical protein HN842_01795 [Gammaproteobacteria bacterium]|jgi:TolB-like protein|nr:hypothetical protein [Gammaproteobacteria bacterium]
MRKIPFSTVLVVWLSLGAEVSANSLWDRLGWSEGARASKAVAIRAEQATPPYSQRLRQTTQLLADQIKENQRLIRVAESTVVVASIVDMEHPKESSRIGRSLSNSLIHELQVRGYNAIDFHLMKVLQVTDDGDYVNSNDVTELRSNFDITYMLSGTLSEHSDGLTVTLRLTDWETGVVVSTAQAYITTEDYFGLMSNMEISRPVVKVIRQNVPMPAQRVMKIR